MANRSLNHVNLKIQFARKQLAHLEQAPDELTRRSVLESTLFLLNNAYQHYLRELAETYHLKQISSITSTQSLSEAFLAANKSHAELDELFLLEQTRDSWLSQMRAAYDLLWAWPQSNLLSYEDYAKESQELLISAVNLDKGGVAAPIEPQILRAWLGEFVALIQRQRATSAEF